MHRDGLIGSGGRSQHHRQKPEGEVASQKGGDANGIFEIGGHEDFSPHPEINAISARYCFGL